MKKALSTTLLTLGVCLSPFAIAAEAADNRVAHYQAAQADSVDATLRNLRDANRKLTELLAGDVTDHDIHDIHSLSYTLEDSLQRLIKELRSLRDHCRRTGKPCFLVEHPGDRCQPENTALSESPVASLSISSPPPG